MTDKDIIIFRKLIKYYFLIFITFALKGFFFPDAFVPEDLQFLVRKYEDEVMEYSPPILFAAIIAAIIYLISFIMIYRLKINWRGKSFWYHLPLRYDDVDVSNRVDEFIDKVLSGKIR